MKFFINLCFHGAVPTERSTAPQQIRYSLGGARDVVKLSTPTSKFEHLLIISFCLLFFDVVLAVFFSPFWRVI
jgi:hypothetical protein